MVNSCLVQIPGQLSFRRAICPRIRLAWDQGRQAIAGVLGGIPVTVRADEVLAFSAGEGITPAEAATIILAAELQPFIAGE